MPKKKAIATAQRRHQDYLRQNTLRVSSVYEVRLAKARRKELKRVLALAKDCADPLEVVPLIEWQIDERSYLGDWWKGLIINAGLPMAQATAQDLLQAKAAAEKDMWLASLQKYASTRAGEEISVVSGTWKNSLVTLVRTMMENESGISVEKLARELYTQYTGTLEKWQCRRIAQTESMIGAAQAASDAARTLGVGFTKQWCISGLGNTRESHEKMDGVIVDEDEPFELPGGRLMFPHDTSMGAEAGEIINCACACIRRPKPVSTPSTQAQESHVEAVGPAAPPKPMKPKSKKDLRIQEMMAEMDPKIPEADRLKMATHNLKLEKALGTTKGKPMSIEAADMQSANPLLETSKAYSTNCATCAPAYALREQGFNVTAKGNFAGTLNEAASNHRSWDMWKTLDGKKAKPTLTAEWMWDNKIEKMDAGLWKKFFEESCKEQGTYIATIDWKKGGGHATILKRLENGKLVRIEPQVYLKKLGIFRDIDTFYNSLEEDRAMFLYYNLMGVMRVDNKLFDPKWAGLFNVAK